MANLSKPINLNFSSLAGVIRRKIDLVFWAALGLVLVLEVFALKNSYSLIFGTQNTPPAPVSGQGVRINFKDYNDALKRIQNAGSFTPSPEAGVDPFTGKRTAKFNLPDGRQGLPATLVSTSTSSTTTPSSTPGH